ncbi:hypothetical protein GCM10027418_16400 [Mariniluteicoccus endophyticus]
MISNTERNILRVLMILSVAGVLMGGVLPRVVALVTGRPLEVRALAAGEGPPLPEVLREDATVRWADEIIYSLPHPTVLQRLVDLLPSLVLVGLLAAGVVVVWRLLDRAVAGDPFQHDAMRSFHVLAGLLAVGAVSLPGLNALDRVIVVFPLHEVPVIYGRLYLDELGLGCGLLAAAGLVEVLGAVFRHGTRLRADSEGLV